jgi:hypothetical protein
MLAGEPDRKSANPIFVYECHRNPDLSGSIVSSREDTREKVAHVDHALRREGISTLTILANTGTFNGCSSSFLELTLPCQQYQVRFDIPELVCFLVLFGMPGGADQILR